jgi:hypothetical protein
MHTSCRKGKLRFPVLMAVMEHSLQQRRVIIIACD